MRATTILSCTKSCSNQFACAASIVLRAALTDQSLTFWNVKNVAQVSHSVKMKIRKKANT